MATWLLCASLLVLESFACAHAHQNSLPFALHTVPEPELPHAAA